MSAGGSRGARMQAVAASKRRATPQSVRKKQKVSQQKQKEAELRGEDSESEEDYDVETEETEEDHVDTNSNRRTATADGDSDEERNTRDLQGNQQSDVVAAIGTLGRLVIEAIDKMGEGLKKEISDSASKQSDLLEQLMLQANQQENRGKLVFTFHKMRDVKMRNVKFCNSAKTLYESKN